MARESAPAGIGRDPQAASPHGAQPNYGALNFRDAAAVWDCALQCGRIFRSSQFYSADVINNRGIKTILDLRKLKEPCKKENDLSAPVPSPCRVCCNKWQTDGVPNPCVLHVDLISTTLKMHIVAKMPCKMWWEVAKTVYKGDDPAAVLCPAIADSNIFGFKWFYAAILDKSKENIAKAIRVFADESNYPILVHCVHGKDRTGLIVMLLQSLCGVPKQSIVKDYTESDQQLKKGKEANELKMADYLKHDAVIAAVPTDCEGALKHIEEKYGSVDGYLENCGVTPEEIQKTRTNLLHRKILVCSESEPLKASDGAELLGVESNGSSARSTGASGIGCPTWCPSQGAGGCKSKVRHMVGKAYRKVVGARADTIPYPRYAYTPLLRHSSSEPNLHFEDMGVSEGGMGNGTTIGQQRD
ncbi:unnamed protein product [Ostreobium quekettii]|uniref:Tyrosine specific protein phosphatases domain-containing protein n=1 Tax=Ostreobium quekettii TaxID=121088 RepID=A0A8S1J7V0_9CHLO|nr:unnamed protein product [Ostreobium quekettii]|eukprot:evm.model.scf_1369.3 EVM.evm.TU.scf_1369.3   scf_1369:23035-28076(+)